MPVGDGNGKYTLTLSGLGEGQFNVTVQAVGPFVDRYVLENGVQSFSAAATRSRNPLTILLPAAVLIIVALIIVLATALVTRNRRLKEHPARGKLSIVRTDGGDRELVWESDLDRFNRNRIQFRQFPRDLSVSKLVVFCDDDASSKEKGASV